MFKPTHRLILEIHLKQSKVLHIGTLLMKVTERVYELSDGYRIMTSDRNVQTIDRIKWSYPDPNCSILGTSTEQIKRLITDGSNHTMLSGNATFDDKFQAIPDMVKDIEELKRIVAEKDAKIAQLRRTIKNLTDAL